MNEVGSRKSKCNILVADINFKVNNKISSWQQTVELYFDENCWQNLQKQGFSLGGNRKVCDVYDCPQNSALLTAPPFTAFSSSVGLHPPFYQALKTLLHMGCLVVLHPPKFPASLLPASCGDRFSKPVVSPALILTL